MNELQVLLEDFLTSYTSKKNITELTKAAYRSDLSIFFEYLNKRNLHPYTIAPIEIQSYFEQLSYCCSHNTIIRKKKHLMFSLNTLLKLAI